MFKFLAERRAETSRTQHGVTFGCELLDFCGEFVKYDAEHKKSAFDQTAFGQALADTQKIVAQIEIDIWVSKQALIQRPRAVVDRLKILEARVKSDTFTENMHQKIRKALDRREERNQPIEEIIPKLSVPTPWFAKAAMLGALADTEKLVLSKQRALWTTQGFPVTEKIYCFDGQHRNQAEFEAKYPAPKGEIAPKRRAPPPSSVKEESKYIEVKRLDQSDSMPIPSSRERHLWACRRDTW